MRARPAPSDCASARRACSVSASPHSESPTAWPSAQRNGKHMAPPMMRTSATSRNLSMTAILSDTLAPPMIATRGCLGFSRMPVRIRTSASSSLPAALGSRCATPSLLACARCATPNASSTYTSASAASPLASSGSLRFSPSSKRTFSSSRISPSRSFSESALTSGPTTAGARVTLAPVSSRRRAATGAIDRPSSRRPSGRPRWETSTSRAPRSRSSSMVRSAATIRVSSATSGRPRGRRRGAR